MISRLNTEFNEISTSSLDTRETREKCGIFGVFAPELDVSRTIATALVTLQHRGQESCGLVSCDSLQNMYSITGLGLVTQVFNELNLKTLKGGHGIGHTRYSTAGGSNLNNAQPVVVQTYHGKIAVAENGNLTTQKSLRQELLKRGIALLKESDIEVITQCLANFVGDLERPSWEKRIESFMKKAEGAYSLAIMTNDAIFGCRDSLGMRPLCIGEIQVKDLQTGRERLRYMLSSETCALNIVGGSFTREVRPGEIVRIDDTGLKIWEAAGRRSETAFCVFEYVYLARPDSRLEGQLVHRVRQRLGAQLAIEAPPPAASNCVIGVPDSSLPAAIGYAQAAHLPYIDGLVKNRYIHRTFIQPTHEQRMQGVHFKYNPLPDNIAGKVVVLVDDSIVRGNTIRFLVGTLKRCGAAAVHVRICCPPILYPCFMGIDFASRDQLLAPGKNSEQIAYEIGADSIHYLSHEGLEAAVRMGLSDELLPSSGYCGACFTGHYPLKIEDQW